MLSAPRNKQRPAHGYQRTDEGENVMVALSETLALKKARTERETP